MASGKINIAVITQKRSQDYELIAACYHEAGHVICGLLYFMNIPSVSVRLTNTISIGSLDEDSVEGNTDYEVLIGYEEYTDIMQFINMAEVYISYAGLVAEKIYYKDICGSDKFPMILRGYKGRGSSEDITEVGKFIKKLNLAPPGKQRYLFKKKVAKDLKQLITEYWDDVRLIAQALYKHKKLYQQDIKRLLVKKSANKELWKGRFKEINTLFSSDAHLDENAIRLILLGQE